MDNKIIKFGYEDTDKKIEIELYGLTFEINKDRVVNKRVEDLDEKDEDKIKAEIDELLGAGAVDKINKKRINDGYNEMTIDIQLAVIGCIFKAYVDTSVNNVIAPVDDTFNSINNKMNRYNRNQRRYDNKYNRRYRRY